MISGAIVNLSLVAITCLLLMIYLVKFVFRYKSEYESNPLCTITVSLCLLIVMLASFVLPVDIFLVSFIKEPDGTLKEWVTNSTITTIEHGMTITYYTLYATIALLIFTVVPFLHFLNEESESNARDRLHSAIKYTFGFALLIVALMFAGAYMNTEFEPNTIFEKILSIKSITKTQSAILMVLTIMTLLGFINVSFYTASGLFSWPIGLLMGTSSVSARYDSVSDQSDLFRVRVSALRDKARITGLSTREQDQLDRAEEDLRRLDREETVLSGYSSTWTYKLRKIIRPIQILVGVGFGCISLLLVATLIIVNVDRLMHSGGPKDGYILLKPTIFNPFEYVCTKAQDLIFIGPIPLLLVTSFLVIATISGVRNLGLWFLFARLHRIKVGRTPPQALLYFCVTIMLAVAAFNLTLFSLAPQYVTFGNQNYKLQGENGTQAIVKPCTLDDFHQDCILTRGSELLMRIMSLLWIFGTIFYWWGWAFVAVSTASFLAYLRRGKRQAAHDMMTDEEEFEN